MLGAAVDSILFYDVIIDVGFPLLSLGLSSVRLSAH